MKIIQRLLFFLFTIHQGVFGSFTATIHSNQSEMNVKTALTITIYLSHPETHSYSIEQVRQNILRGHNNDSPFQIIDEEIKPPKKENENIIEEIEITLEAWSPGNHYLALRGPIFVEKKTGKSIQILSNIVSVTVQSPKEQEEDLSLLFNLMPIEERPLIEISPDNEQSLLENKKQKEKASNENKKLLEKRKFPLKLFLLFLFLIPSAFIGYKFFSKYLQSIFKEEKEKQNPKERALLSLYELEKQSFPDKGMIEEFYISLSRIVRFYIEDQYKIDAPEFTTEEFLEEVKEHPEFKVETQELLKNFLISSDLVKFAHIASSSKECNNALQSAKIFIGERLNN